MNDANVKAVLLGLIDKVEDLEASQIAAIALLLKLSKGSASVSDVQSAIAKTKSSNKKSFEELRKAVDEISS